MKKSRCLYLGLAIIGLNLASALHGQEDSPQEVSKEPEVVPEKVSTRTIGPPQQKKEEWPLDLELYDEEGKPHKLTRQEKKQNPELNLDEIDFGSVDSLISYEKYYLPYKEVTNETREGFKWPTEIYRAVLREDSIVYDLDSGAGKIVYRKAYIFAQEEIAGGETIFIYDKNKRRQYKTNSINVIPIEQDLDLKARPTDYREYEPPTQYHTKDTGLVLDNYFNVHGEYMRDQYLADLFTSLLPTGSTLQSNTFYAYGQRLELKTFYRWDFPIEFGINLNYQEGRWLGDARGLVWHSLFFGPVAQYTFHKTEDIEYNFQVSFQQSLFFNANSLTNDFKFTYSTNALELNLNSIWPTQYGRFVLGGTYRRAQASLKETTVQLRRNPERGNMESWSVLVGYNFAMTLGD